MLRSVVSVVVNLVYCVVLNLRLYTDRAVMPDGTVQEWRRSPIGRLDIAGDPLLAYLQYFFAAVSVITGVLILFGLRNKALRTVQLISTAASTVVFVAIMLLAGAVHGKYG